MLLKKPKRHRVHLFWASFSLFKCVKDLNNVLFVIVIVVKVTDCADGDGWLIIVVVVVDVVVFDDASSIAQMHDLLNK